MTTYFLTEPTTSTTVAFDEVDADMMRLEVRSFEDGNVLTDVEFFDREEARRLWAVKVAAGWKREAGWPLVLDDADPAPRCEDPESHDGEPCDCDWKRAQGWTYCNEYTPGGAGWRRITPES